MCVCVYPLTHKLILLWASTECRKAPCVCVYVFFHTYTPNNLHLAKVHLFSCLKFAGNNTWACFHYHICLVYYIHSFHVYVFSLTPLGLNLFI